MADDLRMMLRHLERTAREVDDGASLAVIREHPDRLGDMAGPVPTGQRA